MASRQYNGQRSRAQSTASNATTQTAASTASTSIPMPTANINNNNAASMTAATTSSGETGPSQPPAPAPIRRNLFHHHLSRRPPSSSTSSVATTAGNNGGSIGSFNPGSKAVTAGPTTASVVDNTDIVVRDKNGGYRIEMPILPPGIAGDDGGGGDLEGMDNAEGEGKISEREKEKIEASLVEMMYRNRTRQMSSEPSEILTLIHQNLRNRVAELDEDKWMYEVEEEIKA